MKRILLLLTLLTSASLGHSQSVEMTPNNAFLAFKTATTTTGNSGLSFRNSLNQTRAVINYDLTNDRLRIVNGSSSTDGIYVTGNNNFVGIGENNPTAKLHIRMNSQVGQPHINLYENNNGYSRMSFTNFGTSDLWTISAKSTDVPSQSQFNLFSSHVNDNVLTVLGNGNVGIANNTPEVPFHVNKSLTANTYNTAVAMFGSLTGSHMNFDGNQIETWSNTVSNTLFLNYFSGGKVQIGNGAAGASLDVQGFTELGNGAPKIKMKKLTGTTPSSGNVNASHGVDKAKILSVTVLVNNNASSASGNWYPPRLGGSSSTEYRFYVGTTNVTITDIGSGLQSRPYKILITYEE